MTIDKTAREIAFNAKALDDLQAKVTDGTYIPDSASRQKLDSE